MLSVIAKEYQMNTKFLKSIPKSLNLLVIGSLVTLLTKVFVFNHIPEPIAGIHEIGIVFEGLLASVFASYVFYLIVIHTKEFKDKTTLSEHLIPWARRIVGDCRGTLAEVSKATQIRLDFENLDKASLDAAFLQIDPNSQPPLLLDLKTHANWLQYLNEKKQRSKEAIRKLFDQMKYLDAEFVMRITKIDNCSHFMALGTMVRHPISNTNMEAFSPSFYKYYRACRDLETYINNEYQ